MNHIPLLHKFARTSFLAATLLLLIAVHPADAAAQVELSMGSAEGQPGDTIELSLSLSGTTSAVALQLQLPLQARMHFVDATHSTRAASHFVRVYLSQKTKKGPRAANAPQ